MLPHYQRSFHQGKIPPEVSQTVRAAEECGDIGRVHKKGRQGRNCRYQGEQQRRF